MTYLLSRVWYSEQLFKTGASDSKSGISTEPYRKYWKLKSRENFDGEAVFLDDEGCMDDDSVVGGLVHDDRVVGRFVVDDRILLTFCCWSDLGLVFEDTL